MNMPAKIKGDDSGFTLLEVIAVLIITGVITAVVVSRMTSTSTFSLVSEAEILRGHLRYAQYRAMSDTVPWGMIFEEKKYSLLYNKAATTKTLPNEELSEHSLVKSGVTIITNLQGNTVNFNEWGNPVDETGALITSDKSITLSAGTSTQTLFITQNTGFIP